MASTMLDSPDRSADVLVPGTEVEVRNRFDRHWATGFELHAVVAGGTGYRIRRISDGAVLPTLFDVDDVRRRGSGSGVFSPFRR